MVSLTRSLSAAGRILYSRLQIKFLDRYKYKFSYYQGEKSLKICDLLYRGITFLKYVLIIHIICHYHRSRFCSISRRLRTSPSPWLHILNYLGTATDFWILG